MCGRTRPIKKFVPANASDFANKANKERLQTLCIRCGLPYGKHHIEPEKAVLVRSCDDDAPDIKSN